MVSSPALLPTVRRVADLRNTVAQWRAAGERIALVPTMGALHEGHLSLMRQAGSLCERTVVSVFVNPTQFGAGEDFETYPRDETGDMAKLAAVGVDLMYAPLVDEVYPDGFATTVHVAGLTDGLCGPFRPGHFDGVATVVTKLLTQCQPDVAIFGEKDYQQLSVIRRLTRDLNLPVEIVAGPTVRETDGLAMSSRNAYLTPEQRKAAAQINTTLTGIAARLASDPVSVDAALADGKRAIEAAGFDRIDYLDLCDAETLEPLDILDRPARLLVAAYIGKTRLIDNIPAVPEPA